MSHDERRFICYGYKHDGFGGCRWLKNSPCPEVCENCNFYKTKSEYYQAQMLSEKRFAERFLKVSTEGNIVHLVDADDDIG